MYQVVVVEHSRTFVNSTKACSIHHLLQVAPRHRSNGNRRNINSVWGEDTASIATSIASLPERKDGLRRQASLGTPPRCRRPVILDTVKEDPEDNTRSLAMSLVCAQSTVVSRLQTLGYRRVLARWIPNNLTDRMRNTWVSIC